ncbi:UDP-Glycosyltransferase/glycogen phosphorylase [Rhizophagus irregularis]|uniref:UDP-Glycosyltransferase/glycogen phosphorylase n=1 Tax=Rhizophagus irregularis TaxID=588596 RepID=A0A2N1NQ88_9GLOM|nr:UDP-Glycosyltransferase/glycogen phosphorylase [Rhizophagus irregularis]
MISKNLIFLLPILVLLLNQVYVNAVAQDYVPRNIDIERLPKNILVGSYVGGRSHLKPMLDVATILIERGHNVILLTTGNYEPSSEYPGLKQITLGPKYLTAKNRDIQEDVDYRSLARVMGLTTAAYNVNYEKFKNAAKENNIDLFICDAFVNQPCIDVANNLNKPVVGFTSFMQLMEPKPYKSDPVFGCNISLENEPFFERFRCALIQPLQIAYAYRPFTRQLNDIRDQMNIKSVSGKVSLALIDTFFGFELPQSLAPNVQVINDPHGGAGSAHESLYTGTPMLILPFGGDQMGNAQRLESAGIALSVDKNALDVNDDILNKIDFLLKDEHIKKNSKRMKYLARINSNRKYRAADLIEYMLYSSGLDEYLDDGFLKEWIPAESRMGFIKANNLDVYGVLSIIILALIGIAFKLIKYTLNPLSDRKKSKQA